MPDFSKQQRDFLKGPGNKENFNETNFSGYDQANIAASPTMGAPFHKNGDKDEVKRDKDGRIPTQELDNINLTANSPQTIEDNVKQNRERTLKNKLYADTAKEREDIDRGKFSRSKRDVSDQDYRIFQRKNS